jgi:HEPN domain-containing protein
MSDRDPEVLAVAREWLEVADGDLAAARLLLSGGGPAFTVCFHAQQAVEKYVKALLVLNGARFGKTHDIGVLLELLPVAQRPPLDPKAAFELTRSAVASRYPEATAPSEDEARRLLQYVVQVREFIRTVLPPDLLEP